MAAFSSYHHPLFLADSGFSTNNLSAIKMDGSFDGFMPNSRPFYSFSGGCEQRPVIQSQEDCSLDGSGHDNSCVEQQSVHNEPFINEKQRTQSLSIVDNKAESGDEQVTQNWVPADNKKRKSPKLSSSNCANSKDGKQEKCKKQKGDKGVKSEVKSKSNDESKVSEEPPKGYIHVRARRGQATDSHSLAERVRREKISERMKTLQALVPGCDKVTGKALMLDEIINYVQSLQNQVEFLSMKLASFDPMVYTFGLIDLNPMVFGTDTQGIIPSVQPRIVPDSSCHPQDYSSANPCFTSSTTCSTTCTTFPTPPIDPSTTLQQHKENPNFLALHEDVGSSYWGVNEQLLRQNFINQFGLFSANNLQSLE